MGIYQSLHLEIPIYQGNSWTESLIWNPQVTAVQTKKNAAKIAPHVSSALRELIVIFDKSILSRSLVLAGTDCVGTADSYYGTQNKQ